MSKLNPRVDFIFKKLFGVEENKDLLIDLINSIVDEKDRVRDIIIKNPYNEKSFKSDKMSILDIKAQDALTNKWFNIEMQVTKQEEYDKRALYYWAKTYVGQLPSGINYDFLTKTIGINFLNFNIVPEENYHNVYRLINVKTGKEYMDHLELHFIELEKYDGHKKAKTLLDKWTYFLKDAGEFEKVPTELEEVDTIKKALDVLSNIRMTDDEREIYEAKLKWLRDEESALRTAKNEGKVEGLAEGLEKGLAEGLEKGLAEGLEKGLEKGMEKQKIETAKNMLSEGMDVELISKITKLSKEQILKLKNN